MTGLLGRLWGSKQNKYNDNDKLPLIQEPKPVEYRTITVTYWGHKENPEIITDVITGVLDYDINGDFLTILQEQNKGKRGRVYLKTKRLRKVVVGWQGEESNK